MFAVTFGNDYEEINSHYRNILQSGIPDIMAALLYTEILQDAANIIVTVVVFRMVLKIFPNIYAVFNISVWPVVTAFSWQLCVVSGARRCAVCSHWRSCFTVSDVRGLANPNASCI